MKTYGKTDAGVTHAAEKLAALVHGNLDGCTAHIENRNGLADVIVLESRTGFSARVRISFGGTLGEMWTSWRLVKKNSRGKIETIGDITGPMHVTLRKLVKLARRL